MTVGSHSAPEGYFLALTRLHWNTRTTWHAYKRLHIEGTAASTDDWPEKHDFTLGLHLTDDKN